MPFLFEHFFSTRSILSSSLVLRQIVRVRKHDGHRTDELLKRFQNCSQTSRQILLSQVMSFAQLSYADNDPRNSCQFVHHDFAFQFVLLHFLDTQSSEQRQKICVKHVHPA